MRVACTHEKPSDFAGSIRRGVTQQPLFAGPNTNPAVSAPINMEMCPIDPLNGTSEVRTFIPTNPSYLVSNGLLECQSNDRLCLMMLNNKVSGLWLRRYRESSRVFKHLRERCFVPLFPAEGTV